VVAPLPVVAEPESIAQVAPSSMATIPADVNAPQMNQTVTSAVQEVVIPASPSQMPQSSAGKIFVVAQAFLVFAISRYFS
jgi:hypothetical protein